MCLYIFKCLSFSQLDFSIKSCGDNIRCAFCEFLPSDGNLRAASNLCILKRCGKFFQNNQLNEYWFRICVFRNYQVKVFYLVLKSVSTGKYNIFVLSKCEQILSNLIVKAEIQSHANVLHLAIVITQSQSLYSKVSINIE